MIAKLVSQKMANGVVTLVLQLSNNGPGDLFTVVPVPAKFSGPDRRIKAGISPTGTERRGVAKFAGPNRRLKAGTILSPGKERRLAPFVYGVSVPDVAIVSTITEYVQGNYEITLNIGEKAAADKAALAKYEGPERRMNKVPIPPAGTIERRRIPLNKTIAPVADQHKPDGPAASDAFLRHQQLISQQSAEDFGG
jgi:hypothetical protein